MIGRTGQEGYSSQAKGPGLAALRVLRYRDYRLLLIGLLISNIGTWMQTVAQGWLVYELTDSAVYLGMVGFVRSLPVIVLTLWGGVVADRMDRRKVLLLTQSANTLLSAILATVTALGVVNVCEVMVIAFLTAAVFAFDTPARQSLLPDLVDREDMVQAVALQSAVWNGAGIIGPSLAGVVIERIGLAAAFYLNAASFLAVIGALLAMTRVSGKAAVRGQGALKTLVEGLIYIRQTPPVLGLMLQMTVMSLLARPYIQLPRFSPKTPGLHSLAGAGGAQRRLRAPADALAGSTRV